MIDPVDDTHRRTIKRTNHRPGIQAPARPQGLPRPACQIYQKYREGQEGQLGALGLVVNAITLWNTRFLDAAVTELRAQGRLVPDEDTARLSPLGHPHVNELGRYRFSTTNIPKKLRPFRDLTADAETF
ncbi:Tn3 family transposase [Arthrobacter sp. SIMBA_036]|uniref:Tn3 family transposase n=1 Tax=Arthrobacter sp. SIMBA_036 TaxID=3085778 RepID=UPI00397D87B2